MWNFFRYRHLCIVAVVMAVVTAPLFARLENVRFQRFSREEGVVHGAVHAVYQDRMGFMWFATESGLFRYDGYRVASFRHEPFDAYSLASGAITDLLEDMNGRLWLIVGGALNRYERDTGRFYRYRPQTKAGEGLDSEPSFLYCDRDGRIWVGTFASGLFRYDEQADRFVAYQHEPGNDNSLSDNRVTGLYEDRMGRLWIGTAGGGLNRLDPTTGQVARFLENPGDPFDLGYHHIPSTPKGSPIIAGADDHIWIITYGGGLVRFDIVNETFEQYLHRPDEPYTIGSNVIHNIYRDSRGLIWLVSGGGGLDVLYPDSGTVRRFRRNSGGEVIPGALSRRTILREDLAGNLWVGTENDGIYVYQRQLGIFRHFTHDVLDLESLSDNRITSLLVDHGENLWVGTERGGLNTYSPYRQKFNVVFTDAAGEADLRDEFIQTLYMDRRGQLWLGTAEQGLIRYDNQMSRVLDRYRYEPDNPLGLSDGRISALAEDPYGNFWVGTSQGLYRLDRERNVFQFLDVPPGGGAVYSLYMGNDNNLWVGTDLGRLLCVEPRTQAVTSFDLLPEGWPLDGNTRVRAIRDAGDGWLWVGHDDVGLQRINPATGEIIRFQHDLADSRSLSHNGVSSLFIDSRGDLWIGTLGGGLNRKRPGVDGFEIFTQQVHNLADNRVFGILEDDRGRLWINLASGLSVYDPQKGSFRNYDRGDGLLRHGGGSQSFAQLNDRRFVRGGLGGFNFFRPVELKDNPHPPPLVMTALRRTGKADIGNLGDGDRIALPADENNFTVEFAALDYTDPSKNRYAHKLEGFDRFWRFRGEERTADYTNLDGGTYRLLLRGSNSDGTWNNKGIAVTLEVAPPFWQTWWFYFMEALVAFVLLLTAFRVQKRRLQIQKQEALRQLELDRKTQELEYARRLQLSMLPEENLQHDRLEAFGSMRTATEVGGDYYDFFDLDERRLGLMIGDATGHGFAAGLVVGMTKLGTALWRMSGQGNLTDMLTQLNLALRAALSERTMGMGLGVVALDRENLDCSMAFTGMPYPYHYVAAEDKLHTLVMKGPPLGFLRNIHVQTAQRSLAPGDLLIFTSDGLTERFNVDMRMWRPAEVFAEIEAICRRGGSAQTIAERMMQASDRFAGDSGNEDDMTVLVLRVTH